jgi:hypothetical protein
MAARRECSGCWSAPRRAMAACPQAHRPINKADTTTERIAIVPNRLSPADQMVRRQSLKLWRFHDRSIRRDRVSWRQPSKPCTIIAGGDEMPSTPEMTAQLNQTDLLCDQAYARRLAHQWGKQAPRVPARRVSNPGCSPVRKRVHPSPGRHSRGTRNTHRCCASQILRSGHTGRRQPSTGRRSLPALPRQRRDRSVGCRGQGRPIPGQGCYLL